jgi:O-antigen/teichoic acid export membrane protein
MGLAAVGTLNIAQRTIDTLHDLLAGAAYNLGLPVLSRRQNDGAALARAYHRATQYVGFAALPIFAGIAICATPVILLFLGSEWAGAANVIRILAFAAILQLSILFISVAITATGYPGRTFLLSLASFSFAVGSLLIIQPQSVAIAAALWAARSLATMPLLLHFASRAIPSPFRRMWRAIRAPLLATAGMTAALAALQYFVPQLQEVPAFGQLAILVPAGIAIYVGLAFCLDWRAARDFLGFVRTMIRQVGAPAKGA